MNTLIFTLLLGLRALLVGLLGALTGLGRGVALVPLIATPVARVVFSVYTFVRERD